jgi:hypothetical protein
VYPLNIIVSYEVLVISKESSRLVLPSAPYFILFLLEDFRLLEYDAVEFHRYLERGNCASCWFIACLTPCQWKWKQLVSPQRHLTFIGLIYVTSEKVNDDSSVDIRKPVESMNKVK